MKNRRVLAFVAGLLVAGTFAFAPLPLSQVLAKKSDSTVVLVKATDPLPSWAEGPVKERIFSFMKAITDKNAETFVPFADRYAVFDNDGTILCEKPAFFEVIYTRDRARAIQEKHPEWAKNPTLQKIIKSTDSELTDLHTRQSLELMADCADGLTEDARRQAAVNWLNSAKHPRFGALYKKLHYQPMLELMNYLRVNGFKVFLCSGGQAEFMRCYAEEEYDIPPQNVLGSSLELEYTLKTGRSEILTIPKMELFNVGDNKPITISQHIGKRPVVACGNSDGDLQMLSYVSDRAGPSLSILIHHDDAGREYAYNRGAEKVLPLATEKNWLVVSMKDDFKKIFSFNK